MPSKPPGQKKLSGLVCNLCLLAGTLFILLLMLGLLEFGLRRAAIRTSGSEESFRLQWARTAKETGVYDPEPGIINSLGFHSREIPVRKAKNTLRILVLGGSAAYGWKEPETSWVWYLEKNLQQKYPDRKIEVINGGVSGARSVEEFKLLSRAIFLDPDIVIDYSGWNDLYNGHYCPDWLEGPYRKALGGGIPQLMSNYVDQWMQHHVYLYLWVSERMKDFRRARRRKKRDALEAKEAGRAGDSSGKSLTGDPAAFQKSERTVDDGMATIRCEDEVRYRLRPEGEVPDRFSQVLQGSILGMSRLSRLHGAAFVSILQPSLDHSAAAGRVPEEAVQVLRDSNSVFFDDWMNAVRQLHPKAKQVTAALRARGIAAYDFSGLLEESDALQYTDAVHYRNPETLDRIAREVESVLRENHLLPENRN